jgi:glycine/D-amino acid oxidase-like deaminating enzyme
MKGRKLHVAIVGAGFAGLSLAWHLLKSDQVSCTLFDESGIGKGASGIASGLLHPFPAAASHYSFMGQEALHESMCLLHEAQKHTLEPIADTTGILKLALTDEEKKHYSALSRRYLGLKWLSSAHQATQGIAVCPALLIEQGITVFSERYVQALWSSCQTKGALLQIEKIHNLNQLSEYDFKVFCHGPSIHTWDPHLNVQLIKGQILVCQAPYPLTQRSLIAKGYIVTTSDPLIYILGSTYERHYTDSGPDESTATKLIFEQCSSYLQCAQDFKVLECRAAIRVSYPKTHLPIIKKYTKDFYAMTAFGSRGLLYHGLLGKQLAESILYEDDRRISREFFLEHGYT